MATGEYDVVFFADPAAYLEAGRAYFDEHPVESNVITIVADRAVVSGRPEQLPYFWFALVRRGRDVVGAAMRTAPAAPYPLYVTAMPEAAAALLARAVVERGEDLGGANGSLPAARLVAEAAAALQGGRVERTMPTRLWKLDALVPPTEVAGAGRFATVDDAELCEAWFNGFHRAADEQAGRPVGIPGVHGDAEQTREQVLARIDGRRVVLWERGGEVVHLSGLSYPVFGVGRIGPVYTPPEHRGHGYAAAGVAHATRLVLGAGGRAVLFTDTDNPVSHRVYARIGYVPRHECANFALVDRPA